MKQKNYANAKDVLPRELYEEVKKHFMGTLYISETIRPEEKRKLVLTLYEKNMDVKEIAAIVGISVRRVNQILLEEREKGLAAAQNNDSAANGWMG